MTITYYGYEIHQDFEMEKFVVCILGWEWHLDTLDEAKKLVKENWRRA